MSRFTLSLACKQCPAALSPGVLCPCTIANLFRGSCAGICKCKGRYSIYIFLPYATMVLVHICPIQKADLFPMSLRMLIDRDRHLQNEAIYYVVRLSISNIHHASVKAACPDDHITPTPCKYKHTQSYICKTDATFGLSHSRNAAAVYSSSSSSLSARPPPSFRMGILIPCVAKHLLRSVLSQTPGNFFAEYTWKTSLKTEARIGDLPLLTGRSPFWPGGGLMSQNENRSLDRINKSTSRNHGVCDLQAIHHSRGHKTHRKEPSVRTLRSCMTNQIPILSLVSCNLKALPAQLPIRFLVNIP